MSEEERHEREIVSLRKWLSSLASRVAVNESVTTGALSDQRAFNAAQLKEVAELRAALHKLEVDTASAKRVDDVERDVSELQVVTAVSKIRLGGLLLLSNALGGAVMLVVMWLAKRGGL